MDLVTNQVGNFFTDEQLVFPIHVAVNGSAMLPDPAYGGCNHCHGR